MGRFDGAEGLFGGVDLAGRGDSRGQGDPHGGEGFAVQLLDTQDDLLGILGFFEGPHGHLSAIRTDGQHRQRPAQRTGMGYGLEG